MSDERPEALLKSALEKIIYFEARSEALHNDLATARDEASRLKTELAQASQRELELRRHLAETEVQLNRSHREREELGRMNDALRGERGALIQKFIEATRIHQSDMEIEDGGFDLASFIALLRSEAMGQPSRTSSGPQAAVAEAPRATVESDVPAASATAVGHAERLRSEGRLELQDADLTALTAHRPSMPGRTEETLFGFSLRELSAPDGAGRTRAAERLKALGQAAAAPALATALHRESDARVLVALLAAFAELAGEEGVPVVAPHLRSKDPDVRIAALKALLSLDASQAAPHLSAAMKDPDAAVRRRATLLALGLTAGAALQLGTEAIDDADPEVRAVGALALGAAGGEAARGPLLRALDDSEEKVRAAAAKSVGRVLGEDVSSVVKLAEAQRRREIRRLATLPPRPVSSALAPTLRTNPRAEAAALASAQASSREAQRQLAEQSVTVPSNGFVHEGQRRVAEQSVASPSRGVVHEAPGQHAHQQILSSAHNASVHVAAVAQPVQEYAVVGARPRNGSISALIGDSPGTRSQVTAPATAAPRAGAIGPVQFVMQSAAQAATLLPAAPSPAASHGAQPRPASGSPAPTEPPKALLSAVLTELRRSIRGLTLPDLSAHVGKAAPEVERACAALTARGDVVRRGIKYFVA